jgi:hypothetical protein
MVRRRQPLASVLAPVVVVLIAISMVVAAPQRETAPPRAGQKTFATPEEAVSALLKAAESDDLDELLAIFGTEAKDILSSGDPVDDRNNRHVVVLAMKERWTLADTGADSRELVVGAEEWPFPIPLVREKGAWRFDTATGKEEILARRIGRNELAAIRVCLTYVVAQQEYAAQKHDGKPAGLYARKVASEPGMQDGLYWETKPGEELSPLGALTAAAAAEGYAAGPKKQPTPFHGYYYRILTAQGPAADGGALNYIVNGDMTGGFALVAYPAEYANSGIMTFIVNQDGIVYESDLGEETYRLGAEVKEFNPDEAWARVEPEPESLPPARAKPRQ